LRDDVMRDRIVHTMPLGAVGACDAGCAERVVAWLWASRGSAVDTRAPDACERDEAPPPALRLLTRAEWRAAMGELFPAATSACAPTVFRFDAAGRAPRTVHVAGSFNGWPATIAGGGVAMVASGSLWSASATLPAGTHRYKFVVDEREWISDPTTARRESDGFGGQNAVIEVTCATPPAPVNLDALAATLPPDVKPQGFYFDDHAEARRVTSAGLTALLAATKRVVEAADLAVLAGCDVRQRACADALLERFAARAWRRPVRRADVDALRVRFPSEKGDSALRGALVVLLTGTNFLYRAELGAGGSLTGPEIAAALAFALTGAPPDATIAAKGADGSLLAAEVRAAEARRLLATERAREQLGRFVEAWFGTAALADADKNPSQFPAFDDELRDSMRAELRAFGASALLDRRDLRALVGADRSFVNERLARHYGIAGVSGGALREVPLPEERRYGVLSMAATLATLAHSDQTSPVKRGAFVRNRLLCQEFGTPPANAGGVPTLATGTTARERFEAHAQSPACASCHKYIDDLGFSFERFDASGVFRSVESNGQPIDTSGLLLDLERLGQGTSLRFAGLAEVASAVAESQALRSCFSKQWWRFVHGRSEGSACAGQASARSLANGGDTREAIVAMFASPAFLERR
jgi:hypothetical protein